MNKIEKGKAGEDKAAAFLKMHKYTIVETNYKNQLGEIDIIAKHKNCIVFIEVKARGNTFFGFPREAVTKYKQNKIKIVAKAYLQKCNLLNSFVRFDVIEILPNKIEHIINAF